MGGYWWWAVDNRHGKKEFDLFGESTKYGKFDPKGLKRNVLSAKKILDFQVRIDGM